MPGQYPKDLTATAVSNRVVNQPYSIDQTHPRVFVPSGGPFYTVGLQIRNAATNQLLEPVTDYVALHLNEAATIEASKEVCSFLFIKNTDIHDVLITRQVIGGDYENLYGELLQFLDDNSQVDYNQISWSRLVGKPDSFPPAAHAHLPNDWRGYTQVIALLDRIRVLLEQGDAPSLSAVYNYLEARALEIKAELAVIDGDDFNQASRILQTKMTTGLIAAGNFEGDANGRFYLLRAQSTTGRFVTSLENYENQGVSIYVRDPIGTHELDDLTRYSVSSTIETPNEATYQYRKKHGVGFTAFDRSGTNRISTRAKLSWMVAAKDGTKLLLDDGFEIDYGTAHADNLLILRPGQSVEVEMMGAGGAGGGVYYGSGNDPAGPQIPYNPVFHDARLYVDGTLVLVTEGGRPAVHGQWIPGDWGFTVQPTSGAGGNIYGLATQGNIATVSGVEIEYLVSVVGNAGAAGGMDTTSTAGTDTSVPALYGAGGRPFPSLSGTTYYGYDLPTPARMSERPELTSFVYLGAGVGGWGRSPFYIPDGATGEAYGAGGGSSAYGRVRLTNRSSKNVAIDGFVPKPGFNKYFNPSLPPGRYLPGSGSMVVKKTGSTAVIESPTVGTGSIGPGVYEVRIPANSSRTLILYAPGGGGGGSYEDGVGSLTTEATTGGTTMVEHLESNTLIATAYPGLNGTTGHYDALASNDGVAGLGGSYYFSAGSYDVQITGFTLGQPGNATQQNHTGGMSPDWLPYSGGGDGAVGRPPDDAGFGGGGGSGTKLEIRVTSHNDAFNLRVTVGEAGQGAVVADGANGYDGLPGRVNIL
jgi:hypothetical protein